VFIKYGEGGRKTSKSILMGVNNVQQSDYRSSVKRFDEMALDSWNDD